MAHENRLDNPHKVQAGQLAALAGVPHRTGRYYSNNTVDANTLGAGQGADHINAVPFAVPEDKSYDEFGIPVRSANAFTGDVRCLIFEDGGGFPGKLIAETPIKNIAPAVTTFTVPLAAPVALKAGWVWLAINTDAFIFTLRAMSASPEYGIGQSVGGFAARQAGGYSAAGVLVTDSVDPYPIGSAFTVTHPQQVPIIYLRAA